MPTLRYRFDRFLLDPQARELFEHGERVVLPLSTVDCLIHLIRHRDRPVGRDELAAVVWDRIDVSEVSVSHAIMRLRRLLGDTGNDQRIIRTVPRLGYRWVMEGTTEESPPSEPSPEMPGMAQASIDDPRTAATAPLSPASDAGAAPRSSSAPRSLVIGVAIVLVAFALAVVAWRAQESGPASARASSAPVPAVVLPAEVSAPEQWAWLRLGLMDLIATQLRRGELATAPSESVVALLDRNPQASPVEALQALRADVQIQPRATLTREVWSVRLEVQRGGDSLVVEAHADDAIKAARIASDELLIKLGHTPPAEDGSNATLIKETLRQRVTAAVLSGQLAVARELIDAATPALQNQPEIVLSQASVEFFSGNYENAAQRIEGLLERMPSDRYPELRGRALITLGATRYRQGRVDDAARAYDEAIRLLGSSSQPISLAKALVGRGGVASQRLQLETAAADYGRARALYELGNDDFGVAVVDLNLGMNAIQRGQPALALPILHSASERLRRLGAEDALAASLVSTVDVELLLLDIDSALATSEDFALTGNRAGNPRQRWELVLSRARALAAAGRLREADAGLKRILAESDAQADAGIRLQAAAVLASTALERMDFERALVWADQARQTELAERSPEDYARTSLVRIRALQEQGRLDTAAADIAALQTWSVSVGQTGARGQATLAAAFQAQAEANPDQARVRFSDAFEAAVGTGIPADIVSTGQPLIATLIAAGRIDEASAAYRQLAPWADRDPRAAWSSAMLESALAHTDAAAVAFERARRLAGERALPALPGAAREVPQAH